MPVRDDRGTATAEIAVALPSLILVLGVALAAVQAAAAQLACVDAARVGARALARGEHHATVRGLIRQVAPPGARSELSADSAFARVRLSAGVPLIPGVATPFEVSARAAVPVEERP